MAVQKSVGAWEVCRACNGVGHVLHSCAPPRYLQPGGLPQETVRDTRVSGQGDLFYRPAYRPSPSASLRSGVRVGDLTPDQAQAIEDTLQEAGLF